MNKALIKNSIGTVIGIEGILLILTSIVGVIYQESEFLPYAIVGAVLIALGVYERSQKPESTVFYARDGFLIVALSWMVLSFFGAIPIFITGEIPNFIDALFEIVSGFTTTGSSIVEDVTNLSHVSLFWRSVTHLIGGMGILVFVLAILPNAGGSAIHVLRAELPGPSAGRLVSKLSTTARILYAIYAGLTILELLALKLVGMPWFESICLSFATAATGGFSLLNDSLISYSSSVQIIIGVFMIIFGVNFNIYYLILAGKAKEALKSEELRCYLGIIAVAMVLVFFNIIGIYENVLIALKHSFFQVVSITTTTAFLSADYNLWPTFSKCILIILMFIGASAGSTAGGMKVSRVVMLFKDVKKTILHTISPRRVYPVRFEGKSVDDEQISSIRAYLVIYVLIFAFSLLIISMDQFTFTECFTAVTATINNIGFGLERIGPMCNFAEFSWLSKLVFIFDMLAGRLELIPMLVIFAPLGEFLFKDKRLSKRFSLGSKK